MLTREQLLAQRAIYQKQRQNALDIANANQGAIEAIDWVLAELDKQEGAGQNPAPITEEGK